MIYDVLIIGAGLAGLSAAKQLHAAGRSVLVIDKGRGVGGRAATRRWDGVPVDHGAQFFTARSQEFRAQVDAWQASGVCFPGQTVSPSGTAPIAVASWRQSHRKQSIRGSRAGRG